MSFKTSHSVLEPSSPAVSCLDQDTEFTEFRREKKRVGFMDVMERSIFHLICQLWKYGKYFF